MEKYYKPELNLTEMDLASFLCSSIKTMNFTLEVDEYQNMSETDGVLYFDE